MPALQNQIAVITGGASGIGQAISEELAGCGATVRIIDTDIVRAESVAKLIQTRGQLATPHQCDISSEGSVSGIFGDFTRNGGIDILVNNAGISHVANLDQTTGEDFDHVFQVNVKGAYHCMRASISHMKKHRKGVILNLASIAGMVGLTDRFAYSMSKGALLAMTYSVAKDYLAYNIRCNAISPARIRTPFVDGYITKNYPGNEKEMLERLSRAQPIGRMGKPEEVAHLACFLCSDESSFITGANFPIDGGTLNLSI